MTHTQIPAHLERCNPADFSITRKTWGRGYRFLKNADQALDDDSLLAALRTIPVPATWTEVRLCENTNAYILATGYDGSGKLQYLYHPDFIDYRNKLKFEGIAAFGLALPRMRRKLRQHLKNEAWNERKLLALVVKILDKYHLRIGSRLYAKRGESFGLTTLRKKHLNEVESHFRFEYTGKSGVHREIALTDQSLIEMVEEVADFPGWELFSIKKGNNKIKATAPKVNRYIENISGGDFTAKSFRTWAGTVLTIKYLPEAKKEIEQNPRRQLKPALVALVAARLGNTPSVCEDYYIHPKVLKVAVENGFDPEPSDETFLKNSLYRKHECRALEIIGK